MLSGAFFWIQRLAALAEAAGTRTRTAVSEQTKARRMAAETSHRRPNLRGTVPLIVVSSQGRSGGDPAHERRGGECDGAEGQDHPEQRTRVAVVVVLG